MSDTVIIWVVVVSGITLWAIVGTVCRAANIQRHGWPQDETDEAKEE